MTNLPSSPKSDQSRPRMDSQSFADSSKPGGLLCAAAGRRTCEGTQRTAAWRDQQGNRLNLFCNLFCNLFVGVLPCGYAIGADTSILAISRIHAFGIPVKRVEILIKSHQVILFCAPSSIIWGRLLRVSTQLFIHKNGLLSSCGEGLGKASFWP